MSKEISQAMATEVGMQHEHFQDMARLRGQRPSNTMRMNREELLRKFEEQVGLIMSSHEAFDHSIQDTLLSFTSEFHFDSTLTGSPIVPLLCNFRHETDIFWYRSNYLTHQKQ